jgi:hypothetical protein
MLDARPQRKRIGQQQQRQRTRFRQSGKSAIELASFVQASGERPSIVAPRNKFNFQDIKAVTGEAELEQKFQRLAKEWRKETRHISSIRERSMNRAYQRIIAMGKPALLFILRDLQRTRDHWLWALNMIEDENPASHIEIFDEAVEAWLDWGKQRGYLL